MSVAPPLGKELAATDKKTRDNAIKSLRTFLSTTSDKPMADLEMAKLWKAIFFCFWHSDKPLVQQELAAALADMLLVPSAPKASFHFLKGFWEAMVREWSGLDYLRIDKYYMLVRKFVNGSFRLLAREMWTVDAMDEYTRIISGNKGPLYPEDRKIPTGLGYHLADIYNEELNKVVGSDDSSPPVPLVPLFTPFFKLNALTPSPTTYNRFQSALYSPMFAALLAHSAPEGAVVNYRSTTNTVTLAPRDSDGGRRKRARIEPPELPLKALCHNACLEAHKGDAEEAEKPLSPKELRKGLLKAMFDVASAEDTKEVSRKRMYRLWREATEQAETPGED